MKKTLWTGLAIGVMLFVTGGIANATVLDFEGLGNNGVIPNGYGGLNWNNMYVLNGHLDPGTGYEHGIVSGNMVAYNGYANMAITTSTGDFDFNGAYLTGAWNDGLNITVAGYNNGTLEYTKTVVASAYQPTYFNFDYAAIDKLTFNSFGGTDQGFGGMGTHFAMDNFTFNEAQQPVPEPATMLLMGTGLTGLIAARRKKKA